MILTPQQIFETMRGAGFPPTIAVTMTAIALRESAGNPGVINNDAATGDRSYGLVQINMRNDRDARLIYEHVLDVPLDSAEPVPYDVAMEEKLLDPATNAKAAFLLWGGKNSNLAIAWYIDRGAYKQKYENNLPAAQAAALVSALGI